MAHPTDSRVHVERSDSISTSIDWFAEGEARTVSAQGVKIVVRFVGRKGRKARIAILAPCGARFEDIQADCKMPVPAPPNRLK
jgi:hypothetical protein